MTVEACREHVSLEVAQLSIELPALVSLSECVRETDLPGILPPFLECVSSLIGMKAYLVVRSGKGAFAWIDLRKALAFTQRSKKEFNHNGATTPPPQHSSLIERYFPSSSSSAPGAARTPPPTAPFTDFAPQLFSSGLNQPRKDPPSVGVVSPSSGVSPRRASQGKLPSLPSSSHAHSSDGSKLPPPPLQTTTEEEAPRATSIRIPTVSGKPPISLFFNRLRSGVPDVTDADFKAAQPDDAKAINTAVAKLKKDHLDQAAKITSEATTFRIGGAGLVPYTLVPSGVRGPLTGARCAFWIQEEGYGSDPSFVIAPENRWDQVECKALVPAVGANDLIRSAMVVQYVKPLPPSSMRSFRVQHQRLGAPSAVLGVDATPTPTSASRDDDTDGSPLGRSTRSQGSLHRVDTDATLELSRSVMESSNGSRPPDDSTTAKNKRNRRPRANSARGPAEVMSLYVTTRTLFSTSPKSWMDADTVSVKKRPFKVSAGPVAIGNRGAGWVVLLNHRYQLCFFHPFLNIAAQCTPFSKTAVQAGGLSTSEPLEPGAMCWCETTREIICVDTAANVLIALEIHADWLFHLMEHTAPKDASSGDTSSTQVLDLDGPQAEKDILKGRKVVQNTRVVPIGHDGWRSWRTSGIVTWRRSANSEVLCLFEGGSGRVLLIDVEKLEVEATLYDEKWCNGEGLCIAHALPFPQE